MWASHNICILMNAPDPSLLYREFGRLVRVHRERQPGLTQEELGKRIGLSRTSIVNIEKGRQHVALHQLFLISDALRVSPEALMPARESEAINSKISEKLPPDPALHAWVRKITR